MAIVAGLVMPHCLQAAEDDQYHSQYGEISQRNIFLMDRTPIRKEDQHGLTTARPSMEQLLVVTGIVCGDAGTYAIVENLADGTFRRVFDGDPIAHGMITNIEIGRLWFVPDGQNAASISISAGENLAGLMSKAAPFR